MGFVKLNIPVLVRQLKTEGNIQYQIQPLFIGRPTATHRRFELAMNQFKKEMRHYFKGFTLDRERSDELLWFMFNPDFHFQSYF
ncbi:MAG: hypothetical protein AAGG75_21495, partial [Bacteroidota bacterium]